MPETVGGRAGSPTRGVSQPQIIILSAHNASLQQPRNRGIERGFLSSRKNSSRRCSRPLVVRRNSIYWVGLVKQWPTAIESLHYNAWIAPRLSRFSPETRMGTIPPLEFFAENLARATCSRYTPEYHIVAPTGCSICINQDVLPRRCGVVFVCVIVLWGTLLCTNAEVILDTEVSVKFLLNIAFKCGF